MLKLFIGILLTAALAIGGVFVAHQTPAPVAGSFSPTGGTTYRLGQSIGTSDTTFKLSSFKEPVSNIPYTMAYLGSDIEYATLSPQSSVSEFVSFTGISQNSDGSATLSGVTRGLSRTPGTGGCVASTTLAQAHAGQSIFILSNSPCFYAEYLPLRTTATSSAVVVFSSTTPPRLDQPGAQSTGTYIATTSEFASIAYVNAIAIGGVSNATAAVKGIVQLATAAQAALGTALGSTGASLALPASLATSTPGAQVTNVIPVTGTNQKLAQAFLDLTQAFTFSTTTSYSGNFGNIFATSTSRSFINYASTTAITATTASSTNLFASSLVTLPNPCTNCTITAAISTTTTLSASSVNAGPTTVTATALCVSPKLAVGGGYSGMPAPLDSAGNVGTQVPTGNGPNGGDTGWTVSITCGGHGSCNTGTVTVYALCVNP